MFALSQSQLMPAVFIGHGSPMLALQANPFTPKWRELAQALPQPKAILCISAHWVDDKLAIGNKQRQPLLYDFYGFPKELYQLQYPVSGSKELVNQVKQLFNQQLVEENRGLDHGAWIVAKEMYPQANIPITQLSLNLAQPIEYHLGVAKKLYRLRQQGVLVLGSGNLIHNLGLIDWRQLNTLGAGYDWAKSAQDKLLNWLIDEDWPNLINYQNYSDVKMAIANIDHYLPILYILALKQKTDTLELFNTDLIGGSLDMTSFYLH